MIAELLLEDEDKYPIIELFVINYVFLDRDRYAILCREGVIEGRSSNNYADVILNPKVVNFLKMIAADGLWGNEGSILAISNALGVRLLVFSIIGSTASLAMISESKPEKLISSKTLTISYVNGVHFLAARAQNDNIITSIENIEKGKWKNVPLFPLCANLP